FGLGCVAGAAGVARMHDYLRGAPDHVAALVSVELCSLTYPAAAGPEVLDSRSRMYPDSLGTMGWKVGSSGFQLILEPDLPDL
ncbi:type III polyketide synthase, partial [Mycobacterium sp. ITM-2017-0098]